MRACVTTAVRTRPDGRSSPYILYLHSHALHLIRKMVPLARVDGWRHACIDFICSLPHGSVSVPRHLSVKFIHKFLRGALRSRQFRRSLSLPRVRPVLLACALLCTRRVGTRVLAGRLDVLTGGLDRLVNGRKFLVSIQFHTHFYTTRHGRCRAAYRLAGAEAEPGRHLGVQRGAEGANPQW